MKSLRHKDGSDPFQLLTEINSLGKSSGSVQQLQQQMAFRRKSDVSSKVAAPNTSSINQLVKSGRVTSPTFL